MPFPRVKNKISNRCLFQLLLDIFYIHKTSSLLIYFFRRSIISLIWEESVPCFLLLPPCPSPFYNTWDDGRSEITTTGKLSFLISSPDMSQACHKSSLCAVARYFYLGRCVIVSFLRSRTALAVLIRWMSLKQQRVQSQIVWMVISVCFDMWLSSSFRGNECLWIHVFKYSCNRVIFN